MGPSVVERIICYAIAAAFDDDDPGMNSEAWDILKIVAEQLPVQTIANLLTLTVQAGKATPAGMLCGLQQARNIPEKVVVELLAAAESVWGLDDEAYRDGVVAPLDQLALLLASANSDVQ